MSTHPNAILLLTLTPQNLSRKTMHDILDEAKVAYDNDITIAGKDYHNQIMEDEYEEGYQISAKEGDLIFFDLVTYGYGEQISWDDLAAQKADLEAWAKDICDRHHCTYKISVTANYW